MSRATFVPSAPAARIDSASAMRLIGLGLVLIPLLARAMSLISMLPGWDLDPLIMPMPFTGVGPTESITLDCVALLGAAMMAVFARSAPEGSSRSVWIVISLLAFGSAGVLMHMRTGGLPWLPDGGGLGDRRIGAAWLSAMLCAGALWLCRDDRSLHRLAAAVILGFVAMLAMKAAQQIFIEHAATVAEYRADPARFLAGQGLLPDTPMARAFERRLLQPEATGWFGLANVFATVMAGAVVTAAGLLAVAAAQRAKSPRAARIVVSIVALASLWGLAVAGAKGGALAAAVGFAALAVAAASAKLSRSSRSRALLGSVFGLAAVLGPIGLIVVRGAIGERVGELSLLFRWFYLQGAGRIFAAHPMGVGPDGFQQAYLLAKPPISPEEVTSPHSVMLDWLADLGIPGIAWIVLLLVAAAAIGRVLASAGGSASEEEVARAASTKAEAITRIENRFILLVPGVATLLAAWLERGAVTPDGAVVRLLGLIAWCIAAWGVLNVARATARWPIAFAAGAAAILAHIQIDVAASWPQSVGLVGLVIAIACSGLGRGGVSEAPEKGSRSAGRAWAGVVVAAIACFGIFLAAPLRAWRWQNGLLEAKDQLADVADLNARLGALAAGTSREDPARITGDIAAAISRRKPGEHQPPRTAEELQRSMAMLESLALNEAALSLRRTALIEPSEWRVRREASRMLLRGASAAEAAGDLKVAAKFMDDAVGAMELSLPAGGGDAPAATAPEWRWLAIAWSEAAKQTAGPDERKLALIHAAAALERAAALDPYNMEIALRLMRTFGQLGDAPGAQDKAAAWAGKVLELDPLMRLDRAARGLTESERAEAERTARRP